jgi:transcriptional regulator with XRE-family HTH domain
MELPRQVRFAPTRWPVREVARAADVAVDIVRAVRDQRWVEPDLRDHVLRAIDSAFPELAGRVPPVPPEGMSRADLAAEAGISAATMRKLFASEYFRGAYSSWEKIRVAAKRLGFELPEEFHQVRIFWPTGEIADAAGVSDEVVRRVRDGGHGVAPETRARVLAAMAEIVPGIVDRVPAAPPKLPLPPTMAALARAANVRKQTVSRFLGGRPVNYRTRRTIIAAATRIGFDISEEVLAGPVLWPVGEIAREARVSPMTVNEVCNGRRVRPESRIAVIAAIETIVPEFLDRVPPPVPKTPSKAELAREANVSPETVDNLLNGRPVELQRWREIVAAAERLEVDIAEQAARADIQWPTGEIAAAAGVSPETVVKVRKGNPTVKPELRSRVLTAIETIAPELRRRVPPADPA